MLQTLDFSRLPFKFAELDHRWMVFCTMLGIHEEYFLLCSPFSQIQGPGFIGNLYHPMIMMMVIYIIYIYVWLMMVFKYDILPIFLPNCWKKGVLYCGLCWAALDTGRSLTGAGCFFPSRDVPRTTCCDYRNSNDGNLYVTVGRTISSLNNLGMMKTYKNPEMIQCSIQTTRSFCCSESDVDPWL